MLILLFIHIFRPISFHFIVFFSIKHFYKKLLTFEYPSVILEIANRSQIGGVPMAKYLTKQRKILQDYLESRVDQELSAKKVAQDLSSQGVSLSAIYRNLAELEKEKAVVPCHKEGSREFYFRYISLEECLSCFHLSCRVCSKTEHIHSSQSQMIQQLIENQFKFAIDMPNSVFYGICQECLATQSE